MSPPWGAFENFCHEYNKHTSSKIIGGKVVRNFGAICINTSLGLLDWTLGDKWRLKETQLMMVFTKHRERLLKHNQLPAPGTDQMDPATSKEASSLKSTEKTWKKGVLEANPTPTPKDLRSPSGAVVESETTPKKVKKTERSK